MPVFTDSMAQNRPDLARRVAASTAMAGWATESWYALSFRIAKRPIDRHTLKHIELHAQAWLRLMQEQFAEPSGRCLGVACKQCAPSCGVRIRRKQFLVGIRQRQRPLPGDLELFHHNGQRH